MIFKLFNELFKFFSKFRKKRSILGALHFCLVKLSKNVTCGI